MGRLSRTIKNEEAGNAEKRSMRPGGLKRRWLLNSISFVTLIMILCLAAFSAIQANYYYSNARTGLESRAKGTVAFINKYFNNSYDTYYQGAYRYTQEFSDSDTLEVQFINTAGRIEFSTTGLTAGLYARTTDVQQVLSSGQQAVFIGEDPLTGERIMAVSSPLLFDGSRVVGVMRYVTSLKKIDKQILYVVFISFGVVALLMTIMIVSNLYFIDSIVKSIQALNEFTKKIAQGGYGAQISKLHDDEVGELCDSINEMSNDISAAEKMKTDFISSVSHELRTPLTAITGWGETLMSGDIGETEEIKNGIRIILNESRRLTKMVESLLEFSRMESGRMTLHMEPIDILAEFEDAVFIYMETLKKSEIALEYNAEDDIPMVMGDRERLKQVFFNILDNAAKHGRDGKKIDASISLDNGFVVVCIRDYGAGIPAEELPRVKLKFYKGSSKERGSGIGLAVSDEIVRLHGGVLDIDSEVGAGTAVFIRLPAKTEPSA